MYINHLPIPSLPTNNRRHNNKRVLGHEIPNTSFVLGVVARVRLEVEFEGGGERDEQEQQQATDHGPQLGRRALHRG